VLWTGLSPERAAPEALPCQPKRGGSGSTSPGAQLPAQPPGKEVEIVVPRETDQEQAALLEQLEWQQQQERQQRQASGQPPLPGQNTPTRVTGEGVDPPTVVAEEPLAPPAPVQPERSQRAKRPLDTWQIML